ncbi:MAG: 23S rRNA (uracil(1939)-C(5))-methyltransferase RlmD [Clostridiales bacterium]|nr:23S rRNA (uracil(1939)-C(5))-methyltransferase RlmD [Clostridiales bacterium]
MEGEVIRNLTIIDAAHDGAGIGRHEGMVVFVPMALKGDVITCRITKREKRSVRAELVAIQSPSPDRIEPQCPHFYDCGGCTYQTLSYAAEAKLKEDRVKNTLMRIGGAEEGVLNPILFADESDGYRNNVQLAIGAEEDGPKLGCRARGSHRVIHTPHCRLMPSVMRPVYHAFYEYLCQYHGELCTKKGHQLRHLCLRTAQSGLMATVVGYPPALPHAQELASALKQAGAVTLCYHQNTKPGGSVFGPGPMKTIYGDGYLTDTLCDLSFRISPKSFYQVNHAQAQRLYDEGRRYAALGPGETLIDLYCGTGTIGLILTSTGGKLIGVELSPSAVCDARANAQRSGRPDAVFYEGDAGTVAKELLKEGITADVLVVDPPRKGCDDVAIRTIAAFSPKRIVYISCDCATLARDAAKLKELGYVLKKATAVDLFPRTPHCEVVSLLVKATE